MEGISQKVRAVVRFGIFELDLRAGELRRNGVKVKLQDQPFRVLEMLLERPGELVAREELQKKLWSDSTFVDFEHGLNAAIKRLREALDDNADNPRFVETLPRRGYRFIAPVEALTPGPSPGGRGETESVFVPQPSPVGERVSANRRTGEGAVAPVYDRRSFEKPAVIDRRYSYARLAVLVAGVAVATLAVLVALNVAGLRDRLMTAVGARRAVPLQKIESLAVLPLENLSGDKDQEYFSDGMTEELISSLGKIGSLRVISRTSVMQFKGARPAGGLAEIAQKLNVDAVVEGSVMRSGNRVRVTAQLIQAHPEKHLWSESYERDLRDVLALQGEVARAIAAEIRVKVTPQEQTRLATVRRVHPRAHEAYLKGRYVLEQQGPVAARKALGYFQQAIEIDPGYAMGFVGLALPYIALEEQGEMVPQEAHTKAKAAVVKALEIDPMLAEAHAMLGSIHYGFEWDWVKAERQHRLAIELNPNSADAHDKYGGYLEGMGRREEGLAELERANELDPQLPGVNSRLFGHYWLLREYDKAIEIGRRFLELEPNNPYAHATLGWPYVQKGMYAEAVSEFEKAVALAPGNWQLKSCLGRAYAEAGMKTKARAILREFEERSRIHHVHPYRVALIYIGLRENDRALEWLEKAYEERSRHMVSLKVDPWLDPLRSDPRFQDLLRRMNFPP